MTSLVSSDIAGVREELARILHSRAFRDRVTLQHLLGYLVDRTLDGTADELKEYAIGVDVFGKPEGYDPQLDASARVQIGKLRHKLEEYYLGEGLTDTLVFELPKRSFTLSFERRHAEPPAPLTRPDPPRRMISWLRLLPWTLAVGCFAWALFLTVRTNLPGLRIAPEVAEIWRPFLAGSRPILISLGTHQFYEYPGGFIRQPDLDLLSDADREARLQALRADLHSEVALRSYRGYTGVGQATAAFLLGRQFYLMKVPVDLARSSVLSWDDIARHNVIFLGSAKSNNQLLEIPVTWAFRMDGSRIVNLQQKEGEAAFYGSDYSLVSLFTGLHGKGEILIVESGSTTGVWAAAQFLTDAGYAKEMVAHMRQPDGRLPRHYQVILKSQIAAGVPIRISYVVHRSL